MDLLDTLGILWILHKLRILIFIALAIYYPYFWWWMIFGGGLSGKPFLIWCVFIIANAIILLLGWTFVYNKITEYKLRKNT